MIEYYPMIVSPTALYYGYKIEFGYIQGLYYFCKTNVNKHE